MFLLKKTVNTQLRGFGSIMTVNKTQLLAKTIVTEILSPIKKKSGKHPHKIESDRSDNNRKIFLQ